MALPHDRNVSPRIARFLRELEGPRDERNRGTGAAKPAGGSRDRARYRTLRQLLVAAATVIGAGFVVVTVMQLQAIDATETATLTSGADTGIHQIGPQVSPRSR